MTLVYPSAKSRGASAAAVSRLQEHGQALADQAADPDAAHAVGIDRAGLRPRDRARGRPRPHHPAARASRSASASSCTAMCSTKTAAACRTRWSRSGRPMPAAATSMSRSASRAARSEFHRRRPRADGRARLLPLRHHQARRLSLGQSPQRLAAGPHPLLGVRPFLRLAPGHADVFPRRSRCSRSIRSSIR